VIRRFGLLPFRSPLLRKYLLVSIPPGTKMFQFPGYAPCDKHKVIEFCSMGFPHSEISGSKVVWHLPETYRSQTTSFVAPFSQGIHHAPLMELPVRSSTNRFVFCVLRHLLKIYAYQVLKFLLRLVSKDSPIHCIDSPSSTSSH